MKCEECGRKLRIYAVLLVSVEDLRDMKRPPEAYHYVCPGGMIPETSLCYQKTVSEMDNGVFALVVDITDPDHVKSYRALCY